MLNNYLKIALRNLFKYKIFSFINIFGLAAAMSVCMLIMLMWEDQRSYDQFHHLKDRIYRIVTSPIGSTHLRATIPFPTLNTLKEQFPNIEESTFLRRGLGGDAVYTKPDHQLAYTDLKGYFTGPGFFKIFDFELEKGDPNTALSAPHSMVITHDKAIKLFGIEDPIGKSIQFADRGLNYWTEEATPPVDWGTFTITGVFAENHHKSHLRFESMASASTLDLLYKQGKIEDLTNNWSTDHQVYGYVLLKKSANENDLVQALNLLTADKLKSNDNKSLEKARYTFQPLTRITPGEATGNSSDTSLPLFVYYILGGLALVIMVSACLNYTSIAIARSVTRSSEIGVRQVNGAIRKDLLFQFLVESMVTVFLALGLANIFLILLKNTFLHLWLNQFLRFELGFNLEVYLLFLIFTLVIGLIAGIYPAIKMSRFSPIKALKNMETSGTRKMRMRRILTVSQFAISLIFIITSILIYDQLKIFTRFDYGFSPENVINVNLQSNDYSLIKKAFSNVPGVEGIAACAYVPADGRNDNTGLKIPGTDISKEAIDLSVDDGFTDVLKIDIVAGKKFPAASEGTSEFIMVNEQAARDFGYQDPGEMVGQVFEVAGKKKTVSGVFKDFTFFLLFSGRPTGPIVFQQNPAIFKFANIRITPNTLKETITRLEEQWRTIDPIHPMQYEYYDAQLADNNQGIFDLISVIGFLTFIAIVIACLGLLGMATYTTERRTKEIGIRKVLGANSWILNYILSREFLMMLAVAIVIAAPASYFLNHLWLDFMVVRADFGWVTIVTGSVIVLILGFIVVIPQTYRIANQNPIETLKVE